MTPDSFVPPQRVPTLTEVIAWPAPAFEREPEPEPWAEAPASPEPPRIEPAPVEQAVTEPLPALPPAPAPINEDRLVQEVLLDLQRQIDLMLDHRLREMLAPLLARATDALIRDARNDLALTLREIVARAVSRELARHRSR